MKPPVKLSIFMVLVLTGMSLSNLGLTDAADAPGFNPSLSSNPVAVEVADLKDQGIRVSLFMDPDPESIEGAREVGADRIELYTEPYAEAYKDGTVGPAFKAYADAAQKARDPQKR